MANETFIDGVGKIGIHGGAVRCELISVSPTQDDQKPEIKNQIDLVMTLPGLFQVYENLRKFIGQLEEKGVITAKDQEGKK